MRRDKCSDEGQASESTALENLSSVSMLRNQVCLPDAQQAKH